MTGWNTEQDYSGTHYNVGDKFNMPAGDVWLFAEWGPIPGLLTVTYNSNGAIMGDVPVDSFTYGATSVVALKYGPLFKLGYRFAGWNTQADGKGTAYAIGTQSFIMPGSNVTLYAQWTPVASPYNVHFFENSDPSRRTGTAPTWITGKSAGDTITIPANTGNLAYQGYTLVGWNTEWDYSGTHYNAGDTFSMPAGDVWLFAEWKPVGSLPVITNPVNNAANKTNSEVSGSIDDAVKDGKDVMLSAESGSIELTSDNLTAIIDAGINFNVQIDGGSLTITPETLAAAGINGSSDVVISFAPASTNLLPADSREALTDIDPVNEQLLKSRVYDVTITSDGVAITTFNTPLELSFEIDDFKLSDAQKSRLTVIRINKDGSVNQLGGKLQDGKLKGFTSRTSQYSVIVSDSLVSIGLAIDKETYTLNGESKTADVAPSILGDRTMVPIRFITEAMGAVVEWDGDTSTVTITLDSKTTTLTIGKLSPGMDVAPVIVNSRTMVPLRYIAEAFDSNVIWDGTTQTVDIYR